MFVLFKNEFALFFQQSQHMIAYFPLCAPPLLPFGLYFFLCPPKTDGELFLFIVFTEIQMIHFFKN